MDYGILSVLPPLIAIVLALVMKETIISLFMGVWLGATIMNSWNPVLGFVRSFTDVIVPQIADSWNATMLVLFLFSGGFVQLMKASGAAYAVGEFASKKISSRRNALTITWLSSFAFFLYRTLFASRRHHETDDGQIPGFKSKVRIYAGLNGLQRSFHIAYQ